MKTTVQWTMLAFLLGSLIAVMACTTSVQGVQLTEQQAVEKMKTIDDAIKILGAPDNVTPYGDDLLYAFVSGYGSGVGFGIGSAAWQVLYVGKNHYVTDTLLVLANRQGEVLGFKALLGHKVRLYYIGRAKPPSVERGGSDCLVTRNAGKPASLADRLSSRPALGGRREVFFPANATKPLASFATKKAGSMPLLVEPLPNQRYNAAVGAHRQYFSTQRLEFRVQGGDRRQLGGSDKREISRIEAEDNPLALVV